MVLAVGWLLWACGSPTSGSQRGVIFPAPDRPVASIVAPAYGTEETRDRLGEAARVMDWLGVHAGTRVADIGAGDGYYTVRLARRLGPGATIYAEDVTAAYLDALKARLAREQVRGVTLILGTPGDPKLPPASVDVALLSHVYHEIANPYEVLYRLRPALAAGARVAIIDLDKPTQDHGTPPALLRCELSAVGYSRSTSSGWRRPTAIWRCSPRPPSSPLWRPSLPVGSNEARGSRYTSRARSQALSASTSVTMT